jgi:membrane fusion protein (multidrug efflux system)
VFHGTVSGIAGGTGSVFTLLPPDNATGNFTKIVQRVPVRLTLDKADTARHLLRPGMSVVVSIDPRVDKQNR